MISWLMQNRGEIYRDGLILDRADIIDALANLEDVSVLDIGSIGIVEDNIIAPNIVSMERELKRLTKRLRVNLKNIELDDGDEFVMHFGIRIKGLNKKLERVIPFYLLLEDGQSVTLLVDNADNKEDFNKNKEVEIKHIVINKKDVTKLILSNYNEDISTIAKKIATILDNTHARFIKKDDNLKRIDNLKLTLSVAWSSDDIEDDEIVNDIKQDKEREEFIARFKGTYYEDKIEKAIEEHIDPLEGNTFKEKLETFTNHLGDDEQTILHATAKMVIAMLDKNEDGTATVPKPDRNIYNVTSRGGGGRMKVTPKVGKKWTKEEKDYIRNWLDYYMVDYDERISGFVMDFSFMPEKYPTKKELQEQRDKEREEEEKREEERQLEETLKSIPAKYKEVMDKYVPKDKDKAVLYEYVKADLADDANPFAFAIFFPDLLSAMVKHGVVSREEARNLKVAGGARRFKEWIDSGSINHEIMPDEDTPTFEVSPDSKPTKAGIFNKEINKVNVSYDRKKIIEKYANDFYNLNTKTIAKKDAEAMREYVRHNDDTIPLSQIGKLSDSQIASRFHNVIKKKIERELDTYWYDAYLSLIKKVYDKPDDSYQVWSFTLGIRETIDDDMIIPLKKAMVKSGIITPEEAKALSNKETVDKLVEWTKNKLNRGEVSNSIDKYLKVNDMMELVNMIEKDNVLESGEFSDNELEKINNHLYSLNMKAKEELGL